MVNPRPHHRVATLSSAKSSQVYTDEEFGDISYRRVARSRYVRIRFATNGQLQATLPLFASIGALQKLIDTSRDKLRTLAVTRPASYVDGQRIGHSHTLHLLPNTGQAYRGTVAHQRITLSYPIHLAPDTPAVQAQIRDYIARALRKESKAYLPRRLRHLADQGGFDYQKVRFAHQSGRWGSCSSSGTISLNIALMNLPFDVIDYVLIHELAHTVQMNHSPQFWAIVEQYCPNYKNLRKTLKSHNPYL